MSLDRPGRPRVVGSAETPEEPQQLQPAVPDYVADPVAQLMLIGQKEQYIVQLKATIVQRAQETNRLHDENLALKARVAELEARLEGPPATEAKET